MSYCNDCGVEVGTPHEDGCDVARCTECGHQRISCDHDDSDVGWGQIWTGIWPGEKECMEWGWLRKDGGPDLNRLAVYAKWNKETQSYTRE